MTNVKRWNDHLAIIFDQVLPAIQTRELAYWVCGGVGVAGVLGRFIRFNEDVDIYVRERDFARVREILLGFCEATTGWHLMDSPRLRDRPQATIYDGKAKRLSVVPVYESESAVEYRTKISEFLPLSALHQELKQIDGFRFFSPPPEIIKILLRSMLVQRPRLLSDPGSRRRTDAFALFTSEEIESVEQQIADRRQHRRSRL